MQGAVGARRLPIRPSPRHGEQRVLGGLAAVSIVLLCCGWAATVVGGRGVAPKGSRGALPPKTGGLEAPRLLVAALLIHADQRTCRAGPGGEGEENPAAGRALRRRSVTRRAQRWRALWPPLAHTLWTCAPYTHLLDRGAEDSPAAAPGDRAASKEQAAAGFSGGSQFLSDQGCIPLLLYRTFAIHLNLIYSCHRNIHCLGLISTSRTWI